MLLHRLGRTDLEIAPLVFGGNVFGWTADKATSFALLDRLAAAGLDTIDTADVYSAWAPGNKGGESETIIGEWLKKNGRRDKTTVITKVGGGRRDGGGLSAAYIAQACHDSLKRLNVETIDLYLAHFPDAQTPYEETLAALDNLKETGKIRWFGASNLDAGQLGASLDAAQANGVPRYEVLQPEYNIYDRAGFEGPLRDLCIAEEIGVITYFSLAKGFLSGKYRSVSDLKQSPRGQGVGAYLNPRGLRILAALDAVAARLPAKPAEVALAWLMRRPGVAAPIASATSLRQVESLIRATEIHLAPAEMAELEAASAAE